MAQADHRELVTEREYRYRAAGMSWPHWRTLDKHQYDMKPTQGPVRETPRCEEGYRAGDN